MNFILSIISSFLSELILSFNKFIEEKNKKLNIAKLSIAKNTYSLVFLISFLLGNFTAMLGVVFKDSLGSFGLIFPISSCIVLYSICLYSLKSILFFNKEKKFYTREFNENKS